MNGAPSTFLERVELGVQVADSRQPILGTLLQSLVDLRQVWQGVGHCTSWDAGVGGWGDGRRSRSSGWGEVRRGKEGMRGEEQRIEFGR